MAMDGGAPHFLGVPSISMVWSPSVLRSGGNLGTVTGWTNGESLLKGNQCLGEGKAKS